MRWLIRLLAMEACLAAILFGSAGRLDLPWFWALIAVHATAVGVTLGSIDPGLARERFRPGPGGVDRNIRRWLTPFLLAHLVVAGLDVGRFGWSGRVPAAVHAAGLVLYAGGLGLAMRSMAVNAFFSPVVRIQADRGHRLVTAGPYGVIRHPGYAGSLLACLAGAAALGSWWSLLPLVPAAVLLIRRIRIEDAYLRTHLDGYADYAGRVRYRLVPGLW